jgi:hypothetical protein
MSEKLPPNQSILQAIKNEQARWEMMRLTNSDLAHHLRISETRLAQVTGLSRPAVSNRLRGETNILPWEAVGFAHALGVPRDILDLSPTEALQWVLDNAGNKLSCCVPARIAS